METKQSRVALCESAIDAIFADLNQCRLPGAVVGISIEGIPVYRKGFGLASMDSPLMLSPSMRLRIGSISKHFTCLAYLLLCEDGKASLDDTIGTFLPQLHPSARGVTMRQLMGNVSGLRDVYDVYFRFSGLGAPVSSAELLALYGEIGDVNAPPSTTWCYNNGGWLLLTAAIERICGRSLEQVLRERIFLPIGMYDTLMRRLDTDFLPNSAAQHARKEGGGFEKRYWGLDNLLGAGAIVSTLNDMLRWLAHMRAPVIGNHATWVAMRTPQLLTNGTYTGYGLGLMIDGYRGVETIWHGGNALGGNAQMLSVPKAGLDVVVITNRGDVSGAELTEKILDACLTNLEPPSEVTKFPCIGGVFQSRTTNRVIQLFAKDGQQIASIDAFDLPVSRYEATKFRPARGSATPILTLKGDAMAPDSIELNEFGAVDQLVRESPASSVSTVAMTGRYRSDNIDVEARIFEAGNGMRMRAAGRFGSINYVLEQLGGRIWRAKWVGPSAPAGGVLTFEADSSALRFSTWYTRSLVLTRTV